MTTEELQAMMDETAAKAAAWAAADAVAQYISAQGHSDFEEPILSESDPSEPAHVHGTPPIVELHDSEERVSLSDRSISSERAPRRYAPPRSHQHSSASDQAPRGETRGRSPRPLKQRAPSRERAARGRRERSGSSRPSVTRHEPRGDRHRGRSFRRGNSPRDEHGSRYTRAEETRRHRENGNKRNSRSPRQEASRSTARFGTLPARISPFIPAIMEEVLPLGFRIPNLPQFDGTGDPQTHLNNFFAKIDLYGLSDAAYCKIFQTTLTDQAQTWFNGLPGGSLDGLGQLSERFLSQYSINKRYAKTGSYLFKVKQREGEPLRDYVQRFVKAVHEVPNVNHDLLADILQHNLRHVRFQESIARRPPQTLEELLNRAEKFIRIEEAVEMGLPVKRKREEERHEAKRKEEGRSIHAPTYPKFTPLKAKLMEVWMVAEQKGLVQPPRQMKENPKRQKSEKYCEYHRDRGHTTDECFQLKQEIERLIKKGHLGEFVDAPRHQKFQNKPRFQHKGERPNPRKDREDDNLPTQGIIAVISGGPSGGDTPSSRRASIRAARGSYSTTERPEGHIYHVHHPNSEVTFSDDDLRGPRGEHNDALVISASISNYLVKKILVDGGSSADIIYYDAFEKLGIANAKLAPVKTPLVGFTGHAVEAVGEISLVLSLGSFPCRATNTVNFLVVKAPSTYNVILGRPSMNLFRAVPSTYHMKLKFPTASGVGEAVGDQRIAREYYANTLKAPQVRNTKQVGGGDDTPNYLKRKWVMAVKDDFITPSTNQDADSTRLAAVEELKSVELIPGNQDKLLRVGTNLEPEAETRLVEFLRKNGDVFAWRAEDLEGIPPSKIVHRLDVDPKLKPVKQKKRTFGPERNKHIKEEVDKLLAAGQIRPVQYPEWLSNVVLVAKSGGKWRLCVDFTNLNKACPKDPFPLPRIDQLVDSTSGCELLSFLDAYQGYNQIQLAPEDQEKASFITDQGIYCYKVMPFGLKNAGATYQRLVNTMFANLIGRNMEVYIDDMLVKSAKAENHLKDLEECFAILREYKMKLNPSKCSFGVKGGKFLGYMISQRGIEANPAKIDALINMAPPKSIKNVQQLNGCLAALNRFISRSADKGLPFFRVLREGKNFKWTEECQKAFEELKQYLASPPLLTKPREGDELLLYLATTSEAISAVLVLEGERGHQPIYYVSRALRGAEQRYSNIERLALALITAARKLRPYFQSHQVVVLTNFPLKQIFQSPETSGRMAKWAIELSEYGVEFRSRPAIKAQVLADFLVEMTFNESTCSTPTWTVYVDGSSTTGGSGAGIWITSPEGDALEYALKLEFPASNNEAEYEALVAGLKLAQAAGAKKLVTHSDSQLVVNQVLGTYEAKEESMIKYLELVKRLMESFEKVEVRQIPRAENAMADKLARLASSMSKLDSRKITFLSSAKPEIETGTQILCTSNTPCWKDEIIKYLSTSELPQDGAAARKLKIKAARFLLIGEELYKRGFSVPYLRCLGPDEARYVLREIHEGICGNHLGGRALAIKALRQGYFWPTMRQDARELVEKCRACQIHANITHVPGSLLQPIDSPVPFAQWGIDLVGPFPQASGQRKFLIVAVDYFTKWVEAEPLAKIAEADVIRFLWKNVVCRFGIPRALISDNGTQFCGSKVADWCEGLSIKQFFTSVGNPQANGQTEVTNRTILQHLKARLGEAKGAWVEELPSVLWAYRTTPRTSTGESPFNLAYGMEAVVPAEIGQPSWRISNYSIQHNDLAIRASLDLVDEVREGATMRMEAYKARMARAYNQRVKPRSFQVGDLVLRRVGISKAVGKLDPKWEGPYKVTQVVNAGAYRLQHMDGNQVPRTWNIGNLKKYFA
ncbi:PREDICTED: uncharacterized protein LOC105955856 [Erythranthe guttata]|uniref:uncharacterized protein LOC105955856 n=1 Tax=Erythranthe guttata TaxID=4155 RepID=UPI00064DF662|nr:PREDICTED: uncharacterized protein LOC105955856 [Erythranthe guttata]|eukprot:XP_012835110.1 PREDICTED: uncharacterized protein LOC105955856 [Erythranthe guttata]